MAWVAACLAASLPASLPACLPACLPGWLHVCQASCLAGRWQSPSCMAVWLCSRQSAATYMAVAPCPYPHLVPGLGRGDCIHGCHGLSAYAERQAVRLHELCSILLVEKVKVGNPQRVAAVAVWQGKARQGKARQDKARQGKTRQGKEVGCRLWPGSQDKASSGTGQADRVHQGRQRAGKASVSDQ